MNTDEHLEYCKKKTENVIGTKTCETFNVIVVSGKY